MILGLVSLHRAALSRTGAVLVPTPYLASAVRIYELAVEDFRGEDRGYHDTRADREDLFVRSRTTYDGATPCGSRMTLHAAAGPGRRDWRAELHRPCRLAAAGGVECREPRPGGDGELDAGPAPPAADRPLQAGPRDLRAAGPRDCRPRRALAPSAGCNPHGDIRRDRPSEGLAGQAGGVGELPAAHCHGYHLTAADPRPSSPDARARAVPRGRGGGRGGSRASPTTRTAPSTG